MPRSTQPNARHLLRIVLACLGILNHPFAHASSDIQTYKGTAFNPDGHVLYKESHWIRETSGRRELLVLFECIDGKPFARKHVSETKYPDAPLFTLEDARTGYQEGVRETQGGTHEVYSRSALTKPEASALLDLSANGLVVDAGFDHFIHNHWESLATGVPQRLEFVVPSKLRPYPFTLGRVDDELRNGRQVRRFLLEMDAWYAFAIPPIAFVYSLDSQTIQEYEGVSSVRDRRGKSLNVHIEFSSRSIEDDPRAFEVALAARLEGDCPM